MAKALLVLVLALLFTVTGAFLDQALDLGFARGGSELVLLAKASRIEGRQAPMCENPGYGEYIAMGLSEGALVKFSLPVTKCRARTRRTAARLGMSASLISTSILLHLVYLLFFFYQRSRPS